MKREVLSLHTFSRARYGATLGAITSKQLQCLDKPVSALYRRLYGFMRNFPEALLYALEDDGGRNLPWLSEQINKGKRRILDRVRAPSTKHAVSGMMARLARLTCRSTIPGDSWAIMPGDTTTHKLEPWLGSLVESRHSVGRVLAREGFPRTLLNSPLMDPVGKSEHRDEDADIRFSGRRIFRHSYL